MDHLMLVFSICLTQYVTVQPEVQVIYLCKGGPDIGCSTISRVIYLYLVLLQYPWKHETCDRC